jgi:hypothetical protein
MLNRAILIGFVFWSGIIHKVFAQDAANDWCSGADVRKAIIETINNTNAAKAAGVSIIDLAGGETVSRADKPYKVVCQYELSDSTGDIFIAHATITKNSLGAAIIKIEEAPKKR